jgi:protocatechuate 3,4-dioxygenase beta subunit
MEGLNMRKLNYALALMLSAGVLLAKSPFAGNWKMDQQKSKYTKGDIPKAENMAISDQGDHLVVAVTGTDETGEPIAIHYIIPVNGGTGQVEQGGSYNGVSARQVNDNTRDTTYMKDSKPVVAEHMVVASDGKTMTITVKGVDTDGKPVEGTLVFDKE